MNDTPQAASGREAAEHYTGQVRAGPGGAMTDEVGVITGDLTLATRLEDDGLAHSRIEYTDADEWYTLTGSPQKPPASSLRTLHEQTLKAVRTGGAAQVPPT